MHTPQPQHNTMRVDLHLCRLTMMAQWGVVGGHIVVLGRFSENGDLDPPKGVCGGTPCHAVFVGNDFPLCRQVGH